MDILSLQTQIEAAFLDVRPGKIGIREAAAMEDRADSSKLSVARAKDQEEDWRQIPGEMLRNNPHVLSFLDDPGFKFLLPAILRWSLCEQNHKELISEFLYYYLNAETRAKEKQPAALVKKHHFTTLQIQVITRWLEAYIQLCGRHLPHLEVAQLERWKSLAKEAQSL